MPRREPLDVLEAIHSTPARRYLKPDPIPDEVLWEILDAAIRGPTGGNSQNWGWVVVRDLEVKQEIAEAYLEGFEGGYGRVDRDQLAAGGRAQFGTFRVIDSELGVDAVAFRGVEYLARHIADAPVIVPVLERYTNFPDTRNGGALAASFILGAVQNLALAARAFGIGAPLTAFGVFTPQVREALRLPEGAGPLAIVPMGYPSRGRWAQPKRMPVRASCTGTRGVCGASGRRPPRPSRRSRCRGTRRCKNASAWTSSRRSTPPRCAAT